MPKGKRVVPIQSRRDPTLKFRYMDDRPEQEHQAIDWASCHSVDKAFKDYNVVTIPRKGALYVSNDALALAGLALLPLGAAALAYSGPAAAYWMMEGAGGVLMNSARIAQAIGAAPIAAMLSGFIKPQKAKFTNFKRPCSENAGVNF